jgi:hypothetical protein
MVNEMLDFGRPVELQLTKTEVNQLIQETTHFIRNKMVYFSANGMLKKGRIWREGQ